MDVSELQSIIHPEDDVLAGVRSRTHSNLAMPDVGIGALLSHIAGQHGVRYAALLGTSGGVTAAWLLDGMDPRGIVTCIEPVLDRHTAMSDAVTELGIGDHIRLIHADLESASRRLRDGNYDLVVIQQANPTPTLLDVAARLLRVDGVLVIRHAIAGGKDLGTAMARAPWTQAVALAEDDGVIIAIRDRDSE